MSRHKIYKIEVVSEKPSWLVAAVQKYICDFVRRFGYDPLTGTKRTTIYKIWKVH